LKRTVTISVRLLLVVSFVVITFATGMCTGYGWGYDGAEGTFGLFAGTNNSYCYVNFTERNAGCESAQ
jgi:hypothetical protein